MKRRDGPWTGTRQPARESPRDAKFHLIRCLTALGTHVTLSELALSQRRSLRIAEVRLRTPGYFALAQLAPGAGQPAAGAGEVVNTDILQLVMDASPTGQVVLVILL